MPSVATLTIRVVPAARSRTNTSTVEPSPGTRLVAPEANTTTRPSSLSAGPSSDEPQRPVARRPVVGDVDPLVGLRGDVEGLEAVEPVPAVGLERDHVTVAADRRLDAAPDVRRHACRQLDVR